MTEKARARILKAGGSVITFDQLALKSPRGQNTVLLQGRSEQSSRNYQFIVFNRCAQESRGGASLRSCAGRTALTHGTACAQQRTQVRASAWQASVARLSQLIGRSRLCYFTCSVNMRPNERYFHTSQLVKVYPIEDQQSSGGTQRSKAPFFVERQPLSQSCEPSVVFEEQHMFCVRLFCAEKVEISSPQHRIWNRTAQAAQLSALV